MKKIMAIILIICLAIPMTAEAKTVNRYITRSTVMKEHPARSSKTIKKLHRNMKISLIKKGKKWSKIKYAGKKGYIATTALHKERSIRRYTAKYFKRAGVIRWRGYSFTWYSQRSLPGRGLDMPGRHVDKQGFVCDKYGYIVVASTVKMKLKGAVVPTPFGKYGKCYDCGAGSSRWRDVYVNW